jgi:DeoR/GlpR family transcriptional regulator of sugar metabolism
MSQSKIDRRKRIMAQLLDKKQVTVKALAEAMHVSDATVRRDLKDLAAEQNLELSHGGAALAANRDYSYQAKSLRASEAKRTIGRLVGEQIDEGAHIFLDSGTTCSEVVPFVKRKRNVTVLANSARLALDLEGAGVHLFMIGGEYRPDRMDTVGPMALSALDTVRGYIAFIGADGVSMEFGPSASDVDSAYLHRQVIQNASSTVLLVDHSKFGTSSLFQIVEWEQIGKVITDQPPPTEWEQFFYDREIPVIYPDTANQPKESKETNKQS